MKGNRRDLSTGVVLAVLGSAALCMIGAACGGGEAQSFSRPDSTLATLLAEIQPRVERSSGIEATRPVDVARADADRLRAYLEAQLRSGLPPEKAEALEAAYARFGLLPDTVDLTALLGALLEEQVVGYYDPESDTLFVLDRVPAAQLAPVLAHELVHALQDQRVDLDSLRNALGDRNDPTMAAQAAIEGHATYAMIEWQLSQLSGKEADLTLLPDLGTALAGMDLSALGDAAPVEVLRSAPAVVREGLLFPYIGGFTFMQRAWRAQEGRPIPFGSRLPRSTEQVLHVERYLESDAPTNVRFDETPPAGWTEVFANGLGEHETRIFLEEHLMEAPRAEAAATGWDGDAYRLVRGPGGEALVWVTVWDAPEDADEFAAAARDAWTRRYASPEGGDAPRRPRIERTEIGGRPVVVTLDLPPGTGDSVATSLARVTLDEER
ncbi:MAG: hypothetical protein ACRELC_06275 [Gemmatimonadota bacterium]